MSNTKNKPEYPNNYLYTSAKQPSDANSSGNSLSTAQDWTNSYKGLAWDGLYKESRLVIESHDDIAGFPHIQEAINKSRFMLDLEDDWDEEGSIGYTEETWRKAINLVCEMVKHCFTDYHHQAPAPIIGIGPEGSIDISWRHENKHLLINVDATDNLVTYSGDNGADNSLSGSFNLSEGGVWLLVWLMI